MGSRVVAEESYFAIFLPYEKVFHHYNKLVKLFGMNIENTDGAKRTRTADPLHAMQVLYQLSYGPRLNIIDNNY